MKVFKKAYREELLEGRRESLQEGLQEDRRSLILRLLTLKPGEIPAEQKVQIEQLPLEQLEALGEALLKFSTHQELTRRLENNRADD